MPRFFKGETMKLPISKRLLCCAEKVHMGARVADIGCDHGYLSIELLKSGRASFVHACDLREMPLQKAKINAERFGLAENIRFSQADGLVAIKENEVDTIICAGMGGDLIARIISDCPWIRNEKYRLILQAQSSGQDLRRNLVEQGFGIEEETLVEDGGFLYQVICLRYGLCQTLSPGQQYISPQLLMSGSDLLLSYFERIEHALLLTVEGLKKSDRPQEKLRYYETALSEVREMREAYDRQRDI